MENPSRPKPTFFQIIRADYLAQNYFVMIFAGWVIFIIDKLFEGEFTFFLLVFAAFCTPLGLLAFFWRYRLIASTFENGTETHGRVTEIRTISTGKKSGDYIIHYEYQLNGQMYQYRNRVKKNSFVKALRQGRQVTLLAHGKTPHIAFIKDVYLEDL